jgi:hypothetical protein
MSLLRFRPMIVAALAELNALGKSHWGSISRLATGYSKDYLVEVSGSFPFPLPT